MVVGERGNSKEDHLEDNSKKQSISSEENELYYDLSVKPKNKKKIKK